MSVRLETPIPLDDPNHIQSFFQASTPSQEGSVLKTEHDDSVESDADVKINGIKVSHPESQYLTSRSIKL